MTSPASPTPRLRSARIAGRYRLERKLGAGSMGSVYLANDEETGQAVALKMLRAEELLAGSLTRLQAEFRAIASVRHPQIAQAFDFGYAQPGNIPYYTREYIAGAPLPPGPPGDEPAEAFLRPILDLLEGLDHLHAQGLLHLDVHAGNLIVASADARGSVLIDIGLAPSPARSQRSPSEGPWPHLPPELLRGEALAPATDLFLVGRLLLYRLSGRTGGGPVLPREIPGWGTRRTLELERILGRALQPVPAARFASAGEFRAALHAALGTGEGRTRRTEPPPAFFGRAAELRLIDAVVQAGQAGGARVLSLVGRRGLGKSRLLAEARVRAQLRGLSTIEVRFLPDPTPEPALLLALRRVRRQPSGGSNWLDLLNPRCGGTPAERAERAAEACCREAGPPLAFLIDDLDFADRESRLLVAALAAQAARQEKPATRGRGVALIVASERGLLKSAGPQRSVVRVVRPLAAADSRKLLIALLHPHGCDEFLAQKVLRQARGSPLLIRRLALAIRSEREAPRRAAPRDVEEVPPLAAGTGLDVLRGPEQQMLEALAVLARAVTTAELAAALDRPAREVRGSLERLLRLEAVAAEGRGERRRYQLPNLDAARKPATLAARRLARSLNGRLAAFLAVRLAAGSAADLRDQENLARHLLALGELARGRRAALAAAKRLRDHGATDRAVRLLEELAARERHAARRFTVCEHICEALEPAGDHARMIAVLDPFLRRPRARLPAALQVRLRRRLGISHHRAGSPRDALRLFAEVLSLADPRRDLEDLLFIDSELAEIHIFQGSLAEAEAASRRGLERLRTWGAEPATRARMEVMLRASLGHIHLRRLALPAARAELTRALALSARHGSLADRAAIFHNLGVVENQLHHLAAARRRFRAAEQLLARAGEHRNLIKVSTNLALIAAKLGRREEAEGHVERAESMLRRFPGRQLECFAAYSRGLVSLLFGEAGEAAGTFGRAASLAHELGDAAMESFSRAYLGEALTLMGHYGQALKVLSRLARSAPPSAPLRRLVLIRLHLVEALLGRLRPAARRRLELEALPREEIAFLEAWNNLFHGLGLLAAGEAAYRPLASALEAFTTLRVPAGERFSRLALGLAAIQSGNAAPARAARGAAPPPTPPRHAFLDVAEPLLSAAASLAAGDAETAERWLSAASAAIVGRQFLELDLHLELLRTRIASRRGETGEARRHVHRLLSSRDLLVQFVPARSRESFLCQPRFAALNEAASRAKPSPALWHSTARLRGAREYAGMVGRSPPMLRLFAAIERLRDQGLPVLITGETGTGKELAARALVERGPRADRPFQTVHCACLPPELFESEFFGREAGAFTGAERSEPGLIEAAGGGTLLLDELSELAPESQAKLLRFLDSGSFRRVGETQTRRADVRILATTSADLRELAARGEFREDLYWRLAGVELKVPPLRERREDIDLLARRFLERHAQRLDRAVPEIDADAGAWLRGREWPGNVRELETGLFRALLHLPAAAGRLARRDLEALFPPASPAPGPRDLLERTLADRRRELDRQYLTQLFFREQGDLRAMMRALGVKTTKLYQWLRDLGLDLRELRRRLGE